MFGLPGLSVAIRSRPDVEVSGVRELLRRAIENVLRNAIRYSSEHSQVIVEAALDTKLVTLSIRDHGPGVPAELLTRIFDPFFRGEENGSASGSGSGRLCCS